MYRRSLTLSDFLTGLVLFLFLPPAIIVPMFLPEHYKPETMIGTAGLTQTRAYCGVLLLTHLIPALLVPISLELCALLHRKSDGKPFITLKWRIPIAGLLAGAFLFFYPRITCIELQTRSEQNNRPALLRAASLFLDIGKDLSSGETVCKENLAVMLKQCHYQYTYSIWNRHSGKQTYTETETEYMICTRQGEKTLAQISASEYRSLNNTAFAYDPQTITFYCCSGMIAAIGGKETVEPNEPEDLIALTYDPDAGFIRRRLLSGHEENMPDMYLHTEVESAYFHDTPISRKINGLEEISFKPHFPCTFRAWVEKRNNTGETVRISNIIEYTVTESVLPD